MSADAIVYIVDDDEAIRKSLMFLLKSSGHEGYPCASAKEFLDAYDRKRPGCLVLDVRMPGMTGLELQEMLATTGIDIPIIIMTGHGDISMAVKAMKTGARDFIEKPFDNQLLLDRIQEALEQAHQRWTEREQAADISSRLAQLTRRERETMDLLVRGRLNKQVAAELGISVRTVEAHRARIMDKLDARSLSDLVRMSLMQGIPDNSGM
jgi:FixJ family two-component response regulator